ncbi:FixH family protein [Cohnella fermenti]|nr:FixH family protein [Cohnella fermenti]
MRIHYASVRNGIALAMLLIALGGCTSNTEGLDENGLKPHLTVDLKVEAPADVLAEVPLSVEVKKSGEPLVQAEKAEFVVWPDGDSEHAVTIAASEQSPGVYTANYAFGTEGMYIVQSRVSSGNLEVMPAKRIAIGAAAVEALEQLEGAGEGEGEAAQAASEGHHH